MCGICGYFHRSSSRSLSEGVLDAMVDSMAHRGPDGRGTFRRENGALGHRRLTIIDLVGGQQPMTLSDEGIALVTNGEVYNYPELRARYLSQRRLVSTSDTEVLLHLLAEKGEEAVPLLNGMFAFACWDMRRRRVILARDPVGQKPLFYAWGPDSFVFASELSSLALHPDVSKEVDTASLPYYLLHEAFPHPLTPLKGVRKLSPGSCLVLDLRQWTLEEKPYWDNPIRPPDVDDEGACFHAFEEGFLQSLKRHSRADVEVGIYLSGGLDSTSIVKGASEVFGGPSLSTFTIKHEMDSFDEAGIARRVADHFGTRHHERLLRKEEFLADMDPVLRKNDEPVADPGFFAIYQVAKFSREYVKVILSGNGGDEFYAGYSPFHALRAYQAVHRAFPGTAIRVLQKIADLLPASFDYMATSFKAQRFLRGAEAAPAELLMHWIGSFHDGEMGAILHRDVRDSLLSEKDRNDFRYLYDGLNKKYEKLNQKDMISILLNAFQEFYLPVCICNHSDKASMRVSQELRSPFLDTELMRLANGMPPNMKYRNGKTKYVLRKYHETNSLNELIKRPKQGFTIPIAQWLTTALKSWADNILDPQQIKKDGFFDADHVRKLWRDHQNRKINNAKKLWTIIIFQHWLHTVLPEFKSKCDEVVKSPNPQDLPVEFQQVIS